MARGENCTSKLNCFLVKSWAFFLRALTVQCVYPTPGNGVSPVPISHMSPFS